MKRRGSDGERYSDIIVDESEKFGSKLVGSCFSNFKTKCNVKTLNQSVTYKMAAYNNYRFNIGDRIN